MADAQYTLANVVWNWLRNSTPSWPTSLKLILYTAPPAKDGTGGTAITPSPQTISLTAPSDGVCQPTGDVTFSSWTAGEIATHYGLKNGSTSDVYVVAAFDTPQTASGGASLTINASDLTFRAA